MGRNTGRIHTLLLHQFGHALWRFHLGDGIAHHVINTAGTI